MTRQKKIIKYITAISFQPIQLWRKYLTIAPNFIFFALIPAFNNIKRWIHIFWSSFIVNFRGHGQETGRVVIALSYHFCLTCITKKLVMETVAMAVQIRNHKSKSVWFTIILINYENVQNLAKLENIKVHISALWLYF